MNDIYRALQAEHDRAWELMNALTAAGGADAARPWSRKRTARELVRLLSGHELTEELVIWPVVRRRCPDGDHLTSVALDQEHDLKLALNELSSISPSEEFDECVESIAGELRTHFSYEQSQVWPRLEDQLSAGEAGLLSTHWQGARATATTKPHPHLPPDPKLLAAAMPLLAVADRSADALRGRVLLPGS